MLLLGAGVLLLVLIFLFMNKDNAMGMASFTKAYPTPAAAAVSDITGINAIAERASPAAVAVSDITGINAIAERASPGQKSLMASMNANTTREVKPAMGMASLTKAYPASSQMSASVKPMAREVKPMMGVARKASSASAALTAAVGARSGVSHPKNEEVHYAFKDDYDDLLKAVMAGDKQRATDILDDMQYLNSIM